jgi:hypothetical protein
MIMLAEIVPGVANWLTVPILLVAVPFGMLIFMGVFDQFRK